MGKTVVVIGSGGRESALIKKYSESPQVSNLIAIPGNDMMGLISKKVVKTYPQIKTIDVGKIVSICRAERADLIDVAQDDAVEAGLVDELEKNNFKVFGPSRKAGQVEWDKAWSRDFMKKYKLPIPAYEVFDNQNNAIKFVRKIKNKKWFIKASGLASGKGVIPAENEKEALSAIRGMREFGKAGEVFVVEQWLEGEEFSFFAICDGKNFQFVGCAQDHKRLYDGDLGPNTGGMGAVSSPKIVDFKIYNQAERIIAKTLEGLLKENRPYKGILYLGAIVVKKKVYIIEFNARWGDPEAQILVPSITNDFFNVIMKASEGDIKAVKIKLDKKVRVVIVGSSRFDLVEGNKSIYGIDELLKNSDVNLYPSRVIIKDKRFYAGSGRLFHIASSGRNILKARQKVYSAISKLFIEGNNLHYRTDIGWRDMERLNS